MLEPEYAALHAEFAESFSVGSRASSPPSPRPIGEIADSVFINNGYRVIAIPGKLHGDTHIRLYVNEVIGESLTLLSVTHAQSQFAQPPIQLDAAYVLSEGATHNKVNNGVGYPLKAGQSAGRAAVF